MNRKFNRRPYFLSFPIAFASLLTIALSTFLYFYLIYTPYGQLLPNWRKLIESDWATIGTVLSGIFSSISVVWIVASVLNQGIELRQQREELRIISDTMKNQEEAMRKQVAALDEQIKVFQSEQEERIKENNRLVLEEYLLQIFEMITDAQAYEPVWEWRYPATSDYLTREDNPKINLLSFKNIGDDNAPIERKLSSISSAGKSKLLENYRAL